MDAMAIEDLLHPYLGKYLESPSWLKASAGRAYSWLPQRMRLGGAYEGFSDEAQIRDPARLSALASHKLGETLAWALDTVPAYEGFRGLAAMRGDPHEILAGLPVTDKLDMKRHPARYLSTARPEGARLVMYTGGSTRNPMRFCLEKHVSRP